MFWKWLSVALRRAPVDRRFRTPLMLLALCLLVFVAWIFLFLATEREAGIGFWNIPFYGLIFGTGYIAYRFIRRANSQDQQLARWSIDAPSHLSTEVPSEQDAELRLYMLQRAAILSAIISRAAGELSSATNPATPADDAVRGAVNQVLRARDLWKHLEPREQELMSAPSGSWTTEQSNHFPEWCEHLRLLRWTAGIDLELTPLAYQSGPDSKLAQGLLEPEPPVLRRQHIAEVWEVRRERDIALQYAERIFLELYQRGLVKGDLPDLEQQIRSDPSTDLIVGAKTVAQVENSDLQTLLVTSAARVRYTAYLKNLIETKKALSFDVWTQANANPTAN